VVSVNESVLHPDNVAHKTSSKMICLADLEASSLTSVKTNEAMLSSSVRSEILVARHAPKIPSRHLRKLRRRAVPPSFHFGAASGAAVGGASVPASRSFAKGHHFVNGS